MVLVRTVEAATPSWTDTVLHTNDPNQDGGLSGLPSTDVGRHVIPVSLTVAGTIVTVGLRGTTGTSVLVPLFR